MFLFKNVSYKNILNIRELNIPSHKVTCIVGQSGSGKTTLLRLLNKIISYDEGEILYNDKSLKTIDSIKLRREVIMLPQIPVMFNGNVKENLLIGLKFSEKPLVPDEILYEILEFVQLDKELSESVEKLSGGEKQKLCLARALLLNPEVFLLDEPSSALDEDTEHLIISSLVEYTKKNNKTLIMVTHSKKIAKNFSDNIIEIKNGSLFIKEE
ncbi:ABC transporter ATP-binding protein [Clostridium cochlearium]|uniref:ABC transport system ATP-binding protein n=1 Tax=Clostridium cochlearium TaxID=1494 RepID=A0ABY0QMV7_CLOCO|nr:ABC transporter ATP-binding protein [Clostridium cochlearium]MBV1819247.1 ABC transporter ATP-binding protein [Bacteroidales bacterium MSK.15.36]NSJ91332.1 ABC transporter ATP-binding protein [Coprococcus sp. MSK.21.13]MBU5270447.1 ABC transporter ATP-binding protein [Clostridium cochlearium]MCG4572242.1 ABC transporter ATP-binding protein [Clostridium cochlearium]MCG4579334.1 ABC transporter ATP-binding protein [Clostridium cochlearium]